MLATGCFPADGQWRTFGPPGSGADLRYGLLMVQQTSPQGPDARCTFEFATPEGEFVGLMKLGNPLLFNMTPPFDRVRLTSAGGAACLATPVSAAQADRYRRDGTIAETYNFGDVARPRARDQPLRHRHCDGRRDRGLRQVRPAVELVERAESRLHPSRSVIWK